MAVTLKDVAELAGVSRSAVSRTFTDGASVSAKTRAKVETAADRLGYRPNVLASSLTTRRTKLIGLVSDNFHNPVFLEVFDLFTRTLQDRGLRPLLVNLSGETEPVPSAQMLRQYSVDGVVLASSTLPPAFAEEFRKSATPFVHSFGRVAETPEVQVVGIDNRNAGRMAAETLLARGYKRIAMMAGPKSATSTEDRTAGFREVMQRASGVEMSITYAGAYSFGAGREEMARLVAAGPAEAYFCGDDVLAIGAMSAIESAGLSVPGDIGLIGMNDMEMAGWENIALTTIYQPVKEIIETSVAMIVALIETPDMAPRSQLFDCRLIERRTLRPLS